MRLKRTYVLLLAIVAVVLGSAVVSGFALYSDAVEGNAQESINRSAETKATQLASVLSERTQTVQLQARDPVLSMSDDRRRETLQRFVNATSFQGVSVIDANGTMVAIESEGLNESERADLIGTEFGHRRYFQAAMTGEPHVSSPVEAESGNYIVTVSVPIEREGRVVGTLNAALHVQGEGPFFDPIAPREGSVEVRVDAAGTVVYQSSNWTRERMLLGEAPVRGTNWTVTVARPEAAAVAPARTAVLLQAGAVVLVLVTLAAFGGWVYRSSIHQINELLRGFDRLADRQYDTDIDLSGAEEWAVIGQRFNDVSTELRHQTRQLSILGRVLRHNLRNDMNVIQAHAELIREGERDVRVHAETIIDKSHQLLDTVNKERKITDLLANPSPVEDGDLPAVIRRSIETVREQYPNADISFEGPESVTVRAATDIDVAIEELVTNAVAHSDQTVPDVAVSLETDGDEVVVRVEDDGPGIPEMEQNVLAGGAEIDPLYHGSGLGLWLVNEIVNQSDGSLTFDEKHPRGSVVTLRLHRVQRGQ